MKCVCVSDIHLKDVKTPEAELLIVAGDVTMTGGTNQFEWFSNWLAQQPQKHKVWIAGNHEVGLEKSPQIAREVASRSNSTYLCDSEVTIEGIKIWGSPVTPEFHNWEFNRQRGDKIRSHWERIPENVDILITHGPPLGHHDDIDGEHVGCQDLLDVISNKLKHPPRYHIFGHIHEGYGRSSFVREDGKKVELINASSCDTKYNPVNPAITFEL